VFAFIKQVVNQSVANQIRDRNAKKRDGRRTRSLNRARANSSEGDFVELVADENPLGQVGPLLELALDVEVVLDRLQQDQKDLCALLGIETVAELARRFNQSRSTVQDKVRRLQSKFSEMDVDKYLNDCS
jgi:hypothetical protein